MLDHIQAHIQGHSMAQACKLRHGIMCGTSGLVAAALILCTMHDWPISA